MYLMITLSYLAMAVPEILFLRQQKQGKEIVLYSITIVFAFIMSILLLAGVALPKPMDMIEAVFTRFGR